mmetsp:Transcript_96571/g.295429  ORF Transcript_96571/g.295429 Transcript_96571/m.295429 type:complete len:117 (-) Transcript_96571:61-411(-)
MGGDHHSHKKGAVVAHQGHGKAPLAQQLLRLFAALRHLGSLGYALEVLLELAHVSKRAHRALPFLHKPWMHVLAIVMVLTGHLAEHVHQEEENHHQETRLVALERQLAQAQSKKAA